MRATVVLSGLLLLASAAVAAAPSKSSNSEEAQFRRWLVQYLKNDRDDRDLHNLVYAYALIDLNGDGRDEAIVWARDEYRCGTGGCDLEVIVQDEAGWKPFSSTSVTRPPIKLLSTRTRGWRDLTAWEAGGGIEHPYEARLRFNGTDYEIHWPTDWTGRNKARRLFGRTLITRAKFALFPSKCRPIKEATSVFGPMPITSGKPGSC